MEKNMKPGKYIAICNKTNFDGHYIKVFNFPPRRRIYTSTLWDSNGEAPFIEEVYEGKVDAAWYFLNRVDATAAIEAVYPYEIFEDLFSEIRREESRWADW